MSTYVSRREFGARIHVTPTQVSGLIKAGVLPVNESGDVALEAGIAAWEEYIKGNKRRGMAYKKSRNNLTDGDRREQAKTLKILSEAQLKAIELKEKEGKVFSKEDIEADAHRAGAELMSRLFSIPPRIAVLCEGRNAREIQTIIEDALNEALEALHTSRFYHE